MRTNNDGRYTEAVVWKMLLAAYRAGFEGPLELADEVCEDILAQAPPPDPATPSDIELLRSMGDKLLPNYKPTRHKLRP